MKENKKVGDDASEVIEGTHTKLHNRAWYRTRLDRTTAAIARSGTWISGRAKAVARQAWWRAHWVAPNLVTSPHETDSNYAKRRTQESNEATRVPEKESLRTIALWGIEVFGPREIDVLYKSLEKLKWRNSGSSFDDDNHLVEWIRRQRAFGTGGGWANVGLVNRPGVKEQFAIVNNNVPLPPQVDKLWVEIYHLTASLTCVSVCFYLRDEWGKCYESELNKDRVQLKRRLPNWRSILTLEPSHIKSKAIEDARLKYKSVVKDWFCSNLPGFFSRTCTAIEFPTMELTCTNETPLLSGKTDFGDDEAWSKIIANVGMFDVWTSKRIPALELVLMEDHRSRLRHCTAAVLAPATPVDLWRKNANNNSIDLVDLCGAEIQEAFLSTVILEYLRDSGAFLMRTRESMSLSNVENKKVMGVISGVQQFFDASIGLPVIVRELSSYRPRYRKSAGFSAPAWRDKEPEEDLFKNIGATIKKRAEDLLQSEASIREHLEQVSTIISIRESIKAQRRMELLTYAAIAVAVITLGAEILDKWDSTIAPGFSKLFKLVDSWFRHIAVILG